MESPPQTMAWDLSLHALFITQLSVKPRAVFCTVLISTKYLQLWEGLFFICFSLSPSEI